MFDFARFSTTKPGDILVADGDFTCINTGAKREVKKDPENGELYVECADGKHFLAGQAGHDDQDVIVGLYPEAK